MASLTTGHTDRAARQRVALTLRVAAGGAAQQAALDAWLKTPAERTAWTDEIRRIAIAQAAFSDLQAPPAVTVVRLAAGCVCCVGQLPLRVTLLRALRQRPDAILLLLASDQHLTRVRQMLQANEWSGALHLV